MKKTNYFGATLLLSQCISIQKMIETKIPRGQDFVRNKGKNKWIKGFYKKAALWCFQLGCFLQ